MKRLAGLVALGLMVATSAQAYTLVMVDDGGELRPRRWPAAPTIQFQINQDTGPALPNVAAGSDPLMAVQRALLEWPRVAEIFFSSQMTAVESVASDGVNLITLKNTAANRMAIEMAGGPLGLAIVRSQGTTIVEADIVINPLVVFTTTLDTDAALTAAGLQDLQAVVTHELGHAIGLHHSGVEAATMWSLASVLHRSIDADDGAGARALYPPGGQGAIFGQVLIGDVDAADSAGGAAGGTEPVAAPAFGAQVVALRDGRVAASALTLPDGNYSIEGLDSGTYTLYVEPLDGPHSSVPNVPCIRLGNLSGGGIYNNATLTTDFPTQFFGSNDAPAQVQLGGEITAVEASFLVGAGGNAVNPTLIGPAIVNGGSVSLSVGGAPIQIVAGQRQAIAVAGPNLDQVPATGISFRDSAIVVDTASRRELSINCNGSPVPVLVFEVTVATDAISGARSLALRVGELLGIMTGAIEVLGVDPPTPTPVPTRTATQPVPTATVGGPSPTPGQGCVGDCDGNGTVTVDEIVTMVNVALGTQSVSNCPPGDPSGDGSVTVDEILTAIQNALAGC